MGLELDVAKENKIYCPIIPGAQKFVALVIDNSSSLWRCLVLEKDPLLETNLFKTNDSILIDQSSGYQVFYKEKEYRILETKDIIGVLKIQ